LTGPFFQESHNLLEPLLSGSYRQTDIGPVERRYKCSRIIEFELADYILSGQFVGSCRESDHGYARVLFLEKFQLGIFGSEIMPPRRNTVRFINGEQSDFKPFEQRLKTLRDHFFGTDI
jgi:hypothetical protein